MLSWKVKHDACQCHSRVVMNVSCLLPSHAHSLARWLCKHSSEEEEEEGEEEEWCWSQEHLEGPCLGLSVLEGLEIFDADQSTLSQQCNNTIIMKKVTSCPLFPSECIFF